MLSLVEILGASANPHKCPRPYSETASISQSGKTWSSGKDETNSEWSKSLVLCFSAQWCLEAKDASLCSHLKGREGYRVTGNWEEKKKHWLDQNIIPACTSMSESWVNESVPRELIYSLCVNKSGLELRRKATQSSEVSWYHGNFYGWSACHAMVTPFCLPACTSPKSCTPLLFRGPNQSDSVVS